MVYARKRAGRKGVFPFHYPFMDFHVSDKKKKIIKMTRRIQKKNDSSPIKELSSKPNDSTTSCVTPFLLSSMFCRLVFNAKWVKIFHI